MDVHTPEQRRRNMQSIKSKNTKPELIVMKALKQRNIYFTKHRKDVYGTLDIVFKRKKVAIFIDSDFRHHNLEKFIMPKTNTEFWEKKINDNISRDRRVTEKLENEGWKVKRIWESDIKKNTELVLNEILNIINV